MSASPQVNESFAGVHKDRTPDSGMGFMEALDQGVRSLDTMQRDFHDAVCQATMNSGSVFKRLVENGDFPPEKAVMDVAGVAAAQKMRFNSEAASEADRRFAEMAEGNGKQHTGNPDVEILPPPEKKVA
ncbi:MAG: hypothetical protein K2W95_31050 [Candidatus Obscuribacterales bacterium]|nr:hypothetical protein [Candidatus Obscuribacterales bacterium]